MTFFLNIYPIQLFVFDCESVTQNNLTRKADKLLYKSADFNF